MALPGTSVSPNDDKREVNDRVKNDRNGRDREVDEPEAGNGDVAVRELVRALEARLSLVLVTGRDGLDRTLVSTRVQKPGLALVGTPELMIAERVQVLGRSEIRFLKDAGSAVDDALRSLCASKPPCILVTRDLKPPAALIAAAADAKIPVLCTPADTGEAMEQLYHFLGVRLAPSTRVHGVLMDLFGLGVLVLGESGIGKSECALELVSRGHRLVADDSIEVRRIEDELIGAAPEISRCFLEVRGLGLINARKMFGVAAVAETKAVEQAVRLVRYEPGRSYDRLGDSRKTWATLGIDIPLFELPVAPGRNLAVLLEIAARQRLLRDQGHDTLREIQASMARRLVRPPEGPGRDST